PRAALGGGAGAGAPRRAGPGLRARHHRSLGARHGAAARLRADATDPRRDSAQQDDRAQGGGLMTTTTMNDSLPGSLYVGAILEPETYEPIAPQAVTLTEPRSTAAEAYRMLRYRLELLQKNGVRALAFTSAQGREGRTTVTVNAALALGRGGRHRVAL